MKHLKLFLSLMLFMTLAASATPFTEIHEASDDQSVIVVGENSQDLYVIALAAVNLDFCVVQDLATLDYPALAIQDINYELAVLEGAVDVGKRYHDHNILLALSRIHTAKSRISYKDHKKAQTCLRYPQNRRATNSMFLGNSKSITS